MKIIDTNIKVISSDGGDFANFLEKEDLYSRLSGVKDPNGENMEFIEIGNIIQFNNQNLKVLDINIKLNNIDKTIEHRNKKKSLTPPDLRVSIIITVENIK